MSYCRFGPDSDVYVYAAYNGYSLSVAKVRVADPDSVPKIPEWGTVGTEEVCKAIADRTKYLQTAAYVDIGLPYDGQSFSLDSAIEAVTLLAKLRQTGYRIPAGVEQAVLDDDNASNCELDDFV